MQLLALNHSLEEATIFYILSSYVQTCFQEPYLHWVISISQESKCMMNSIEMLSFKIDPCSLVCCLPCWFLWLVCGRSHQTPSWSQLLLKPCIDLRLMIDVAPARDCSTELLFLIFFWGGRGNGATGRYMYLKHCVRQHVNQFSQISFSLEQNAFYF